MKSIVFLSISFLTFNYSFGQLNDSITDKNKIWYNYIYIYNTMWVNTEVIGMASDTILNDTIYYHVLRGIGGVEIPYQEYGFIREENGKIFYKTYAEKSERLINDFTVSEGDTVIAFNLMNRVEDYFIECKFVCDSIRYKDFYQIQRKVIHLSSLEGSVPEQWIKGIGSYSGLLHNYNGYTGGDVFYLSCVKLYDQFIFKRSETEPCIKIAVGFEDQNDPDPLIHPNPIGSNRKLKITNNFEESIFELYDVLGNLVYKKVLSSTEISFVINVNSGIYLYKLINQNNYSYKTGKLFFE